MTIYEIDKQIEELLENSVDPETGELLIADEELDRLQMAREEKIENIALLIKNRTAEAKAIKEEADKLEARAKAAENAVNRLKEYLKYALKGEKFKTTRVSIYYTSRESVFFNDETAFIEWAKIHDDSLLKYAEPTINKTAVKEKLEADAELPGAQTVKNQYLCMR